MGSRVFLTLGLAALLAGALVAEEPAPRYTGERVSLNLKDVELADFFRLIHEISGLNIVVGPDVQGTLTLVLIDVPWDQALDIVVKNHGLVGQLEGNVLRILTRGTAKRELEAERDLAVAAAAAAPLETITCRLSYAKAAEAAAILKRFLSPRGDIAVDGRTNAVIITDVPAVLQRLAGDYPTCSRLPG